MGEAWAVERAMARFVAATALAVAGVALAWFAYIDAPITDRVMLWIAFAVAAGTVAVLAGLGALALTLGAAPVAEPATPATPAAPTRPAAQRRARRLLRLALVALAVQVLLLAMASVATLNVRGEGTESDTEDTAVAV